MFRAVTLPQNVPGRLYLHSMPGRCEEWGDFIAEASRCNIQTIVCFAPDDEIEKKSPSYAAAIRGGAVSYPRECLPITDYGIPKDREEYAEFVTRIAELLRSNDTILVHCGAGIGRTGTFVLVVTSSINPQPSASEIPSNLQDWSLDRFRNDLWALESRGILNPLNSDTARSDQDTRWMENW